jgi:hypothetical protein
MQDHNDELFLEWARSPQMGRFKRLIMERATELLEEAQAARRVHGDIDVNYLVDRAVGVGSVITLTEELYDSANEAAEAAPLARAG